MGKIELKRIFETELNIYYIKISGRNKYYFKGKKANSQIWNIEKISALEFWEEFEKQQNQEKEEISTDEETSQEEVKESFFNKNLF